MSETIESNGSEVTIDGIVFRSYGIDAEIEMHQSSKMPSRTIENEHDLYLNPILKQNLTLQNTFAITTTSVEQCGIDSVIRGEDKSPLMEIEVPLQSNDHGQLILLQDEDGNSTWIFPDQAGTQARTGRSSVTKHYKIRWNQQKATSASKRGIFGTIGKKMLRVLIFPLFNSLVGKLISEGFHFWEEKKRPYGIRMVTPDDYTKKIEGVIDESKWKYLSKGKSLLFIHGTLNRINTNIDEMDPALFKRLYDMYEGRVFAFEHFTLSHDPVQNVEWFLNQLPSELSLDFDIIAKSRGGLIARVLAEKINLVKIQRKIKVGKVVFVATPNAGTVLADQDYLSKFIDTYTNLIRFIPGKAGDIIETIVEIVKFIAVTGMKSFPGLQAMKPDGEFLQKFNCPPGSPAKYYAISSNFEPTDKKFGSWLKDNVTDAIFKKDNDCIVPTVGVYSENNCPSFPIQQIYVYPSEMGINHENYFTNNTTTEKIIYWLGN